MDQVKIEDDNEDFEFAERIGVISTYPVPFQRDPFGALWRRFGFGLGPQSQSQSPTAAR